VEAPEVKGLFPDVGGASQRKRVPALGGHLPVKGEFSLEIALQPAAAD
jgi:hypothetical protein